MMSEIIRSTEFQIAQVALGVFIPILGFYLSKEKNRVIMATLWCSGATFVGIFVYLKGLLYVAPAGAFFGLLVLLLFRTRNILQYGFMLYLVALVINFMGE